MTMSGDVSWLMCYQIALYRFPPPKKFKAIYTATGIAEARERDNERKEAWRTSMPALAVRRVHVSTGVRVPASVPPELGVFHSRVPSGPLGQVG